MKRSEINNLIDKTLDFLNSQNFKLPPFAFWSPEEWAEKGPEVSEIKECMLGWDVTDFGLGNFEKTGLVIFTLRNGHNTNPEYTFKPYCEKILITQEEQITPMHFHWNKVEDIINRAGGDLEVQLYNSDDKEELSGKDVEISLDGVKTKVKAGDSVILKPGESICLPTKLYHKFWAVKRTGTVLLGEVSKVNDDNTDNRFYEKIGRFPEIEEDVKPRYLLFTEYPKLNK
jgi:D-lyxose ketol-isomerase